MSKTSPAPALESRAYTPAQKLNLLTLLRFKAIGEEKGVNVYRADKLNPLVLGKLRDYGLVQSKVVRSGRRGGQYTAYWLTPHGKSEAEALRG